MRFRTRFEFRRFVSTSLPFRRPGQHRPAIVGPCDSLPWRSETFLRFDILQLLTIVFAMQYNDSQSSDNIPNISLRDSGTCNPLPAIAFTSYRACCRAQLQEPSVLLIPLAIITPQWKRTARNMQSHTTAHEGLGIILRPLLSMPTMTQTSSM